MRVLVVVNRQGTTEAIRQVAGRQYQEVEFLTRGSCPALYPGFDLILVPEMDPSEARSHIICREMERWEKEWLPTRLAPGPHSRIFHI